MKIFSARFDLYLVLVVGLSLFALSPLLGPGYFYGAHDGRHSVFFITMFDEAIRSGALWPIWAMHHNLGFGYPTFLVQAPLAFYVAEVFVLLGAGITTAAKLTWAAAILAGAWGMYSLVKHWCVRDAELRPDTNQPLPTSLNNPHAISIPALCGVVAAILYTYAPYHLLDIYVRAALAETLLMAWLPWVVLVFDRLIALGTASGWQGRLLIAALCYAGALLTHAFALPAFTPLLVGFVLFRLWLTWFIADIHPLGLGLRALASRIGLSLAAGMAGPALAAIYLVPLVLEGAILVQENWTRATYDYERHWVQWGQFFSSFWGYGYSDDPVGANDGMSFQLGVVLLLFAALAIYLLLNGAQEAEDKEAGDSIAVSRHTSFSPLLLFFFVVATAAIVATTTPLAAPLWRAIPLLEVIQFPWRLLALSAFTLSILGGLVIWQLGAMLDPLRAAPQQLAHREDTATRDEAGIVTVLLVTVFASFAYLQPDSYQPVEAWREDGRAVAEFEREHPDMYGYTRYVEDPHLMSPMQAQYIAAIEEEVRFDSNELTRFVVTSGEGQIAKSFSLGHAFAAELDMASPGTVQIQLFAFPGWRVKLDGIVVDYRISSPYGLMEIDVPAGSHTIEVWMGLTVIRMIGMLTSGITFLVLVGLWIAGSIRKDEVHTLPAISVGRYTTGDV